MAPTNIPSVLGVNVKRLRCQLGWSQERLAQLAGISHSNISRLERGRIQDIGSELMRQLAEALGVDCNTLMYHEGNEASMATALRKIIHRIKATAFSNSTIDRITDVIAFELSIGAAFRSAVIGVVYSDYLEVISGFVNCDEADDLQAGGRVMETEVKLPHRRISMRNMDDPSIRAIRNNAMETLGGFGLTLRETATGALEEEGYWVKESRVAYFFPIAWGDEVVAIFCTGSTPENRGKILSRMRMLQPLWDHMALSLKLLGAGTGNPPVTQPASWDNIQNKWSRLVRRIDNLDDLEGLAGILEVDLRGLFIEVRHLGILVLDGATGDMAFAASVNGETLFRQSFGAISAEATDTVELINHWNRGEDFLRSTKDLGMEQIGDAVRLPATASYQLDVFLPFGTISIGIVHTVNCNEITKIMRYIGEWIAYILRPLYREGARLRTCSRACQHLLPEIGSALQWAQSLDDLINVVSPVYGHLHNAFQIVSSIVLYVIDEENEQFRAYGFTPDLKSHKTSWLPFSNLYEMEGGRFIDHWRKGEVLDRMVSYRTFPSTELPDAPAPVRRTDFPFPSGVIGVGLLANNHIGITTIISQVSVLVDLTIRRFLPGGRPSRQEPILIPIEPA